MLVFRDLSEVRRLEMRQVQSSRLQALGEMTANVAHEFNQPLTSIRAFAERLLIRLNRKEWSEELGRENLTSIVEQVERMGEAVKRLQGIARDSSQDTEVGFDLATALDNVLGLMYMQLRELEIVVSKDVLQDLPPCRGRLHEIEQILLNLLLNARQAIQARQQREPDSEQQSRVEINGRVDGERVKLSIGDSGGGIPLEILPHIFEPFFTTKEEGEGTGLGLAISREIAHKYGGEIEVDNRPGEGVIFTLVLPTHA